MEKRHKKKSAKKTIEQKVWGDKQWVVFYGELKSGQGRPANVGRLFTYLAEKIPFRALAEVEHHFKSDGSKPEGVYIAHDSMGTPRYIGRGDVFNRLKAHYKKYPNELMYFSFYIVDEKQHEREIETLLIRAAGDQLEFNDRKKRVGIQPGSVNDYEPRTIFYERQKVRGKKKRPVRK
jgi:hypothetical protein